MTKEYLRADI